MANHLLYKPEYCQLLIDHMSKGGSFVSFAGTINVGKRTIYEWVEKHPEFAEAKQVAKSKCEEFYINSLLALGNGVVEKGNATSLIWLTKNILKWTDKEQTQGENSQPINITISKDDSD